MIFQVERFLEELRRVDFSCLLVYIFFLSIYIFFLKFSFHLNSAARRPHVNATLSPMLYEKLGNCYNCSRSSSLEWSSLPGSDGAGVDVLDCDGDGGSDIGRGYFS